MEGGRDLLMCASAFDVSIYGNRNLQQEFLPVNSVTGSSRLSILRVSHRKQSIPRRAI